MAPAGVPSASAIHRSPPPVHCCTRATRSGVAENGSAPTAPGGLGPAATAPRRPAWQGPLRRRPVDRTGYAPGAIHQVGQGGDWTWLRQALQAKMLGGHQANRTAPFLAGALGKGWAVALFAIVHGSMAGPAAFRRLADPEMLNRAWVGVDPFQDHQAARRFLFHDCDQATAGWAIAAQAPWCPEGMYSERCPGGVPADPQHLHRLHRRPGHPAGLVPAGCQRPAGRPGDRAARWPSPRRLASSRRSACA